MMIWKKLTALVTLEIFILTLVPIPVFTQRINPVVPAPVEETMGEQFSGVITPEEGGVLEFEGVRLEVPPGAVTETKTLTIQRLAGVQRLQESMVNVTDGANGYRFGPHGIQFEKAIKVTLPFDPEIAESEVALSNLHTYFYHEEERQWERLVRFTIDEEQKTITSLTDHFTDMINSTLQLPEGPSPIDFNINSIKDLEAANPASGVPQVRGLEPGPFGSASFQVPLRLPPGRGMATPQLAISYSSDRANSWMGRGFDLSVPKITIDTRFGLPDYDREDTYLLEGEELVCTGSAGNAKLYRPRVERRFQRIRWIRDGGEDYWEVSEKDGSVRTFGKGAGWIGPDMTNRDKTYIWYLTQFRDANGNTVNYQYHHDAVNKYVYLESITYSGYDSGSDQETGKYKVDFLVNYGSRSDRRIDARGKFASKLTGLLTGIDISYRGTKFRGYEFSYRQNEFGQTVLESYTEKDGAGNDFYAYGFDYNSLTEKTEGGYECFGSEEEQWGAANENFSELSKTHSTSAGGSLYTGISIAGLAEIGVRGGVTFGQTLTESRMMDLNGDGLLDVAWKDGNELKGYLNRNGNFDTSDIYTISGFDVPFNKNSQKSFSLGFSANAFGLSGSVVKQYSWSDAKTMLSDINGDGFIDVVEKDSKWYRQHDGGNEFVSTEWHGPEISGTSEIDVSKLQEFRTTYYREDPVRKWQAYRSGVVEVNSQVELKYPELIGDNNAVTAYIHFGNEDEEIELRDGNPDGEMNLTYEVIWGDNIYFHLSPDEETQVGDVNWHSEIRYSQIRLFEDIEQAADFYPPETFDNNLPDERLALIYSKTSSGFPPIIEYIKKANWQDLDPSDLQPVYEALAEIGYFVPKRVSRKLMNQIYSGYYPQLFIDNYHYSPVEDCFYLNADADTSPVRNIFLGNYPESFTADQRKALALYPVGDEYFHPQGTAGDRNLLFNETIEEIPAHILNNEETGYGLGTCVMGNGYLLDKIYFEDDINSPITSLWLRGNDEGDWEIIEMPESGGEHIIGEADIAAGGYSFTIDVDGVKREYHITNPERLIEKLPIDLYQGVLSDTVLDGETFSTDTVYRFSQDEWAFILPKLSDENKTLFDNSYELIDEYYQMKAGIIDSDFQKILVTLKWAGAVDEALFASLKDGTENWRIIWLNQTELDDFTGFFTEEEQGTISGFFDNFTYELFQYYHLKKDLDEYQWLELDGFMERYRRDNELFPYYDREGNYYLLKNDLEDEGEEAVRAVMEQSGLETMKNLLRTITIKSDSLFPVTEGTLPADRREDVVIDGEDESAEPDAACGVVSFFAYGDNGNTLIRKRFIHHFDSMKDFSVEDRIDYQRIMGKLPCQPRDLDWEIEMFRGGAYNWYQGTWSGYYNWNEDNLTEQPVQPSEGVTLPPYFALMEPNDPDPSPILEDGRDREEVPENTWVGPVSSYSISNLDDSGNAYQEEYTFAAYINEDLFHPSRKGGDSYFLVPRGGEAMFEGGKIGVIQESLSESTDINGGVSLGSGLNGSSNEGDSFCYTDLFDINGDRYPDLVQFDEEGDINFSVLPGTGSGFSNKIPYSSPYKYISTSGNNAIGLGASIASSNGSLKNLFNPKGKVEGVEIGLVESPSGIGSVGVNGTLGESFQSIGFRDLNGDGLPDHVSRGGAGTGFAVLLNTGTATFASSVTWGNGMNEAIHNESFTLIGGDTQGLSSTNNGSFGASVSGSIPPVSVSGGFSATVNKTSFSLIDMNGDGLPDQVVKRDNDDHFLVKFNLGDTFSEETVKLYRPAWDENLHDILAIGINNDLSTIGETLGGLNLNGGNFPGFSEFSDGDNAFDAVIDPFSIQDTIHYSTGIGFNLGASVAINISFWFLTLKIVPGVNGSYATTSATLQMQDINGDGLPDHVLKMPGEDFLRVKLNGIGKTGLLKRIDLPMGGSYEIDYERTRNTVAMPQSRYVLSSVTRNDGFEEDPEIEGAHSYTESFSYQGGYYDRSERVFYGFGEVRIERVDGSVRTDTYDNRDFYLRDFHMKGLLSSTVLKDSQGNIYGETFRQYGKRFLGPYPSPAKEVIFPAVVKEVTKHYDPQTGEFLETAKSFDYDGYGNINWMHDEGSTSDPDDDLEMEITYSYPGGSLYLKQLPEEIEVKDANGELLRRRRGYYDTYGNLNGLRQYWDNHDDYGEYELSYNKYGNLTGITDPGGYTLEYSYDTEVSTYVTRITTYNSLHYETEYTSTMEWDYRYGVETASEDLNGNRQEKEYDSFGRISSIRTPYDTGATTALSYEYRTGDYPWKAITDNKLHFDPTNTETMETVVTIDGLGRIIQTAKEGEVYAETGSRYGWNRSGAVVFDAKARPVQEGQTVFEESDENPTLTPLIRPTLKEYDILDRVVKVTLPDGALMLMDYRIESSRFIEITTDPEGNITETVKDVRGNTVEVRRKNSTGELLNRAAYNYNGLGEMITVTDYEGNEVTFQYDLLGRRLNVNSPDAGLIEYEYDEVGNIIRKVDSNLRNRGESIYYEYDGHNRLVTVDYPRMGDVNYTYGDGNTPGNGAGRLLQITDESGIITYGYGKLGETVTINRQLHRLAPLGGNKEAGLEYTYDYLGRMERIIYPDGEEVTYEYDHGGQVTKVTGERNGQETEYIEQIGYDEYGQRVYIRYGNGVETTYTYDENRRWLDNISTENQYGNSYQEINYQFDTVGNILRMENNAEKYYSLQEYTYDDQYQLTLAEGLYESKPYGSVDFTNRYTQEFTFDRIGNITNKVSEQVYNPTRPHPGQLNYNLEYRYYEGKPHQAEQIGKLWYLYDGNGNIIEEREGGHSPEGISGSGTLTTDGDLSMVNRGFGLLRNEGDEENVYMRTFEWDEENRMKRSDDGNTTVDYLYDAGGERTVKYSSQGETLYFDSMWQMSLETNGWRQSKHIYVGATRISTRLNFEGEAQTGYELLNTYYYHNDHLGSANIVTAHDGAVYEHIEYTPYGELWVEEVSDSFDMIPFRFTGKEFDEETNLYYYGARYMNPRTSRWMSADPAMDGQNWYGYCANNPLKYVDPTGLEKGHYTDFEHNGDSYREINGQTEVYNPNEWDPVRYSFWHITEDPRKEKQFPANGMISSAFGDRLNPFTGKETEHEGIDIANAKGTPIYPMSSGTVTETGYDDIYGNYVIVDHGEGITTYYAHLKSISVKKGDPVALNKKLGFMGSTGWSTGPHLHFEVRRNEDPIDPITYLPGYKQAGLVLHPNVIPIGGTLVNSMITDKMRRCVTQ